ncbi:hypothetical protein DSO57_1001630 [Entomophthora muscae]|uniref:Uncharacterized protein n=1 Tax=Entomophthora muscae TaxID=34485 RepID=A0ACC2S024_9FUNG|nr:hypothetical protein DSO57_1001630 [Entomophthora muscae]
MTDSDCAKQEQHNVTLKILYSTQKCINTKPKSPTLSRKFPRFHLLTPQGGCRNIFDYSLFGKGALDELSLDMSNVMD